MSEMISWSVITLGELHGTEITLCYNNNIVALMELWYKWNQLRKILIQFCYVNVLMMIIP